MTYKNRPVTVQLLMSKFAKYSLGIMLGTALLSFGTLTVLKIDYYQALFGPRWADWLTWAMATIVACITEGIRFALLIASARDFSRKNLIGGWLGLIGSLGLTVYDWQVAGTIAGTWPDAGPAVMNMMRFLVVTGILIELRLIMMLFAGNESERAGSRSTRTRSNGQSSYEEAEIIVENLHRS